MVLLNEFINLVEEKIRKDELEEAVMMIARFITINAELKNIELNFISRINRYEKSIIEGCISFEEIDVQKNRLVTAILEILEEIRQNGNEYESFLLNDEYEAIQAELLIVLKFIRKMDYVIFIFPETMIIESLTGLEEEIKYIRENESNIERWLKSLEVRLSKISYYLNDKRNGGISISRINSEIEHIKYKLLFVSGKNIHRLLLFLSFAFVFGQAKRSYKIIKMMFEEAKIKNRDLIREVEYLYSIIKEHKKKGY